MTAVSQRHETVGYQSPTRTALVKDGMEFNEKSGLKKKGKMLFGSMNCAKSLMPFLGIR
jgi:hypothetical protein